MNKILLDTNAYSQFLSGNEHVLSALGRADIVYMSIFVLGELYAGFKGGNKEQRNIDLLRHFLKKPAVQILNATGETAKIFGEVKDSLKKSGTPLPINDVWIASHAIESDSILLTYDKHFQNVSNLVLWEYL